MPNTAPDQPEPIKVWMLLDRSGSMSRLRHAVIEGANQFIAEQRNGPGECRLTLAQFDTEEPFHVTIDALLITDAPALTDSDYQPHAMTPLYDAIGTLIHRADRRIEARERSGEPAEDQVVIIFTDGLENASTDFDRAGIFELIKNRSERGWTFSYLGANQDAYAESAKIGIDSASSANFDASPEGVRISHQRVSAALSRQRGRPRVQRQRSNRSFFKDLGNAGAESATSEPSLETPPRTD